MPSNFRLQGDRAIFPHELSLLNTARLSNIMSKLYHLQLLRRHDSAVAVSVDHNHRK